MPPCLPFSVPRGSAMYKFGAQDARELESFGVSGLLSEDSHVFYDSLFTTKHIGRISDLISARLQKSKTDELRLRALILLSLFESYRIQSNPEEWQTSTEEPLREPMVLEVGIDEEKLAIGVSFEITEGKLVNPKGLLDRLKKGQVESEFEKILVHMNEYGDRMVIRYQPSTRRFEIVTLIGIPDKISEKIMAPSDRIEYIEFSGLAKNTPKPETYTELGDLDYPELLKEDASFGRHNASPTGKIMAERLNKDRAGFAKSEMSVKDKNKGKDGTEGNVSSSGGSKDTDGSKDQTKVSSKDSEGKEFDEMAFSGSDKGKENDLDAKISVESKDNDLNADLAGEKQTVKGGSNSTEEDEKQTVKGGSSDSELAESDILKVKGWKEEDDQSETRIKGATQNFSDEASHVKGHKEGEDAIASEKETEYQKKISELNNRIKSLEAELNKARTGAGKEAKKNVSSAEGESVVSANGVDRAKVTAHSVKSEEEDRDEESEGSVALKRTKKKKRKVKKEIREDEDEDEDGDEEDEEYDEEDEDDEDLEDDEDEDDEEEEENEEEDEDEEEDEEESGLGRFLKKKNFKKLFSFKKKKDKKRTENEDEEDDIDLDIEDSGDDESESEKQGEYESEEETKEIKKIVDPSEVAKNLEKFGRGGSFDHTLKNAEKTFDKVKNQIKSPKVKKFMHNFLEDLTKEKAKFMEMVKELNRSVRQKELQFKNGEKILEEELKRREEKLKLKDREIQRVKDQVSQLTMNIERMRTQTASAAADAQYKKKFNHTKNMLNVSHDDNKKLKKEIGDLKSQLNIAKKVKTGVPSEADIESQKKSMERMQKAIEEQKKQNNININKLREAEQKTKSAHGKFDELKRRMEVIMRSVGAKKDEVHQAKEAAEKIETENIKLKRNVATLQKELLRLKKPALGIEQEVPANDSDDEQGKGSAA